MNSSDSNGGPDARHYAGLSLGRPGEPSGLVVLRLEEGLTGSRFNAYHAAQFPPGTRYADIAAAVAGVEGPPLNAKPLDPFGVVSEGPRRPVLVLDCTGVGREIEPTFAEALPGFDVETLLVTNGAVRGRGVPKTALVTRLQLALQGRRLVATMRGELRELLMAELLNFKAKVQPREDAEDWRDAGGKCQDLVLALAVALYHATSGDGPETLWG